MKLGILAVSCVVLVAATLGTGICAETEEMVIFGFEKDLQDWQIPEWEVEDTEYYAAEDIAVSGYYASEGDYSLELLVDFPGGSWKGAYVEKEMYVTDWSQFSALKVDVYVPQTVPAGLKGRIVLTVGEQWKWTEMNRGIALTPGEWNTITAVVKEGSTDWKFFPDEKFRQDIRKIGVRIESDRKPVYKGPIYIDNVRLAK
ncbi:MAG: hypothetical protein JW844_04475 [Candidatus Omnitrophica bacterium]|nr:hypothetical protein [Candidatus Omnitrophota bacterium]